MTIINLTTTTFAFSMTSTQKLGNPTKALEEWKKCIKFCIAIFLLLMTLMWHCMFLWHYVHIHAMKRGWRWIMQRRHWRCMISCLAYGKDEEEIRERVLVKMRLKGGEEEEMKTVVDAMWQCVQH
jgi:hypothetical protein